MSELPILSALPSGRDPLSQIPDQSSARERVDRVHPERFLAHQPFNVKRRHFRADARGELHERVRRPLRRKRCDIGGTDRIEPSNDPARTTDIGTCHDYRYGTKSGSIPYSAINSRPMVMISLRVS